VLSLVIPNVSQATTNTTSEPALHSMTRSTVRTGPLLPTKDFARQPTLQNARMSPTGKYLAVAVRNDQNAGDEVNYQLVIFELPSLKVTTRLKFPPNTLPARIYWVSNQRVVISEAVSGGTLDRPRMTGELIALNYNGKLQRILYSLTKRSGIRAQLNMLAMPRAFPQIAGLTKNRDGHIYLSFSLRGSSVSSHNLDARRTELFNVDTVSGEPKKVAEINRGSMKFLMHDDQALFAFGMDDNMMPVAYSRNSQSGNWKQLPVTAVGKVFQPIMVAPDGKRVYAIYSAKGGPNQLIETDFNGGQRQILASNTFGSVANIFWGPQDDRRPFATTFSGVFQNRLPKIDYINNSKWTQVQKALAGQFTDLFVDFAGMSRDGSVILVHAYSGRNPGVYALLDTRKMQLKPLFQTEPWIKPAKMGPRIPIRFKNREGIELAGYLTIPAGVAAKNLPMVLIPHGGPIGPSDSWTFEPDAAFLASRGYAVLQVNYRGSGGRGMNFERSGYRQFGTGIQYDLIDGVHWAINKGYANKDRICVYGGSFGGYSSLMQPILAPKLYKCAIDYAGVSDYMIEFNRSDTRRFRSGRTYFKEAIGNAAEARAISPINRLDRFNVPVLIAHGGEDQRVPIQNAEELRNRLETMRKPFEWLVFPKEGHGFYTEPHRLAFYERMQAFFGKYLGPGTLPETQASPTTQ